MDKEDKLYCATTFEKIKKADILAQTSTTKSGEKYAPSASTISLAEIFRNVNKEDSLCQYIPPQFYEDDKKQSGSGAHFSEKVYPYDGETSKSRGIGKTAVYEFADSLGNTFNIVDRNGRLVTDVYCNMNYYLFLDISIFVI